MTKVFVLHMKITSYNNDVNNACLSPPPFSPSSPPHRSDSDVSSDFEDMMDKLQNHNYLSYIKKQKKQLKAQLFSAITRTTLLQIMDIDRIEQRFFSDNHRLFCRAADTNTKHTPTKHDSTPIP